MHYLYNKSARILWKGGKGEYHHIHKGVPQGGISSPFLFKLYIDDISNDICNSDVGCKFGIMHMNVIRYAEDIVLIANKQQQLAETYRLLAFGITEQKLNINKNKSKCMIFTRNTRSLLNADTVVLNGDDFGAVDQRKI